MHVSFQWETLDALLEEPNFRDMIAEWWEEMSPLKVRQVVDWAAMAAENHAGYLHIWTARVDKTLAGFVRFYVLRPPEHSNALFAHERGYYLSPLFRDKARIAWRLFRSARTALKEELGVRTLSGTTI